MRRQYGFWEGGIMDNSQGRKTDGFQHLCSRVWRAELGNTSFLCVMTFSIFLDNGKIMSQTSPSIVGYPSRVRDRHNHASSGLPRFQAVDQDLRP